MKKFLAAIFIILAAIPGYAVSTAYAQPVNMSCSTSRHETADINYVIICAIVDNANEYIEREVAKAQRTPYDDTDLLLLKVQCRVNFVMAMADTLGYEVECVYVEYQVDGKTILIDPLRVVNKIVGS